MGESLLACNSFMSLGIRMRTARRDGQSARVLGGAGDIQAQRQLLDQFIRAAVAGEGGADALLKDAEVVARFAAGRGHELDRRRLAGVLALRAAHIRLASGSAAASAKEAECLLILDELANDGWEEAASALTTFAAEFSKGALNAAKVAAKTG